MSEPTDDELERARRIKRLRAGEAETDQRRRRRRPAVPDETEARPEETSESDSDHEEPLEPDEDHELPADAPEDLTVASMYLTEDLKGKTERIEEHLQLRYEVEFATDIDGPRHVRPLALFLGLRQFERLELDEIRGLFEQVDVVESPEE